MLQQPECGFSEAREPRRARCFTRWRLSAISAVSEIEKKAEVQVSDDQSEELHPKGYGIHGGPGERMSGGKHWVAIAKYKRRY